jgi:hypothetical protein
MWDVGSTSTVHGGLRSSNSNASSSNSNSSGGNDRLFKLMGMDKMGGGYHSSFGGYDSEEYMNQLGDDAQPADSLFGAESAWTNGQVENEDGVLHYAGGHASWGARENFTAGDYDAEKGGMYWNPNSGEDYEEFLKNNHGTYGFGGASSENFAGATAQAGGQWYDHGNAYGLGGSASAFFGARTSNSASGGAGYSSHGLNMAGVRGGGAANASVGVGAEVEGFANAGWGLDENFGVNLGGSGGANATAEADVSATIGASLLGFDVDPEVYADGLAGAEAEANGVVGLSYQSLGLSAGAEAFAGAKAGFGGELPLGFSGVDNGTVSAGGWVGAGAGAEAGFDLIMNEFVLTVGGSVGGAALVGAGADVGAEFSLASLIEAPLKLGESGILSGIGPWLEGAFKSVFVVDSGEDSEQSAAPVQLKELPSVAASGLGDGLPRGMAVADMPLSALSDTPGLQVAFDSIQGSLTSAYDGGMGTLEDLGSTFGTLDDALLSAATGLGDQATSIYESASSGIAEFGAQAVDQASSFLGEVGSSMADAASRFAELLFTDPLALIKGGWDALVNAVKVPFEMGLERIADMAKQVVEKAARGAEQLASSAAESLLSLGLGFLQTLGVPFADVGSAAVSVAESGISSVSGHLADAKDVPIPGTDASLKWGFDPLSGIETGLGMVGALGDGLAAVPGFILETLSELPGQAADAVAGLATSAVAGLGDAADSVASAVSGAVDGLGDLASDALAALKKLADDALGWVSDAAGAVGGALSSAASKVGGWFGF